LVEKDIRPTKKPKEAFFLKDWKKKTQVRVEDGPSLNGGEVRVDW